MLNICTDAPTFHSGLALSASHSCIRNAAATTPHDVATLGEPDFPLFADAARSRTIVAIGETGLDYHYEHSPKELQKKFLIRYLHLAATHNLPVIFHCREAFADLFAITDLELPRSCKAVLHCFTGTLSEAEQVLERGWFLSLSGIVTFKKNQWLRDIARIVPLSQLLIETDAPYLAPQSHRGKLNEPSFLPETAACIALAHQVSVDAVALATFENGSNLFFG
jgi:TatD DNase family protein